MSVKRTQACPLTPAVFAYYKTGDERSLEPVFVALVDKLPNQVRKYSITCPLQTGDIVQATIIEILKRIREHKYKPEIPGDGTMPSGMFWAWAYKILANRVSKHKLRFLTTPSSPGVAEDPFLLAPEQVEHDGSEVAINQQHATQAIVAATQAVLALPQELKESILLVYFKGMTHTAAGKKLGIHPDTVYRRIKRGLAHVRSVLKEMGINPSPEVYAAVPNVNTGPLFEEAPSVLNYNMELHLDGLVRNGALPAKYARQRPSAASQADCSAQPPRA